ncbi:hypothetical protein [Liberiplasma polymorphum]|uniref:hypothetical protein n=1 Tax=Liberiplasma polymorphum TaxID=3374570 RepID=UPI0037743B84
MKTINMKNVMKVLTNIVKHFNEENIHFAVGGSVLLHHHCVVNRVNDIDLFIDPTDIIKAKMIMDQIAYPMPIKKNDTFASDYFYTYIYKEISIDLVSQFKIIKDKSYHYPFDKQTKIEYGYYYGVKVPFMCLEDWVVLYYIMDYPMDKQMALINHIKNHGIINHEQFNKTLNLLNKKDQLVILNYLNIKEVF